MGVTSSFFLGCQLSHLGVGASFAAGALGAAVAGGAASTTEVAVVVVGVVVQLGPLMLGG